MARKVLVADDEAKIVRIVSSYLSASGFEPIEAHDGPSALDKFRTMAPDCLILDVNMPGLDGLAVAREVRKVSDAPIIFLSALADESDRVAGLELGGDDYVCKPFSPRELVARVRAVLRRSGGEGPSAAGEARGAAGGAPNGPGGAVGAAGAPARGRGSGARRLERRGLAIDEEKRRVEVEGKAKELTATQFDILLLLARSPGRVFNRAEILDAVAGEEGIGYDRTVDAHVKNIRAALGDDPERPRWIGTVRGVGYRFLEDGDEA